MSKAKAPKNTLTAAEQSQLLSVLKERFEKNMNRHKNVKWADVEKRLNGNKEALWSLSQMELSGGEPDIVELEPNKKELTFCDCSAESPKGRRSICYDQQALDSRKENKPADSAMGLATEMGLELLTEEQYRKLQTFENFDIKTSSWIATPAEIRKLGGALFCDRRYNTVFVYHNGAESYYAGRSFRGLLKV